MSAPASGSPSGLTRALALRIFLPFALGYFLSYLGRVVNAVLAPRLMADLSLDAADLGFLTSVYFFAFGLFQLPLGILLDRFGPRRVDAGLILFAALGAFLFGAADSLPGLTLGRALMGLGVSACLMAPFTAYRLWFPNERLALVNGLHMAAGGLGAVAGTTPVEAIAALAGWRGAFVLYGAGAIAIAAIVFLVVPRGGDPDRRPGLAEEMREFAGVFRDALFIRVAGATFAIQGTFVGLQSLWAGPWLTDVAGLKGADMADYLLLIALGMTVGYAGMGFIADRLGRRGVSVPAIALTATLGLLATQVGIILLPPATAAPLWILFTFLGASNVLWYSALYQSFPMELAGRVATGLNVFVFFGTFVCQWLVGLIVNRWPRGADGGYPAEAYQTAFVILLGIELAGLGWYVWMRAAKFRA